MYSSDYMAREVFQILAPLFIFLGVFYAVLLVVSLVSYVLRGLAILNMSKARNLDNGWLGFIPIGCEYQLGLCSKEVEIGKKKITNPGLWMVIAPIVYSIVSSICVAILMVPYFLGIISLIENPSPDSILGFVSTIMIVGLLIGVVLTIAQFFWFLIRYIIIHKIFSHYSEGQKPVFYLIIAMFVPLAEPILLYMHSKRPLLPAALAEFPPPAPVVPPAAIPEAVAAPVTSPAAAPEVY